MKLHEHGDLFSHLTGNWFQEIKGAQDDLKYSPNNEAQQARLRENLERMEKYFGLIESRPKLLELDTFDGMETDRIFEYLESQI
ncbi:MAG: hypothetical protein HYZ51_04855 [Candidatus Doudnabacteria bacterium]|nr:hypothetical protein [Candidatus Doudnabacteria bacterium]